MKSLNGGTDLTITIKKDKKKHKKKHRHEKEEVENGSIKVGVIDCMSLRYYTFLFISTHFFLGEPGKEKEITTNK